MCYISLSGPSQSFPVFSQAIILCSCLPFSVRLFENGLFLREVLCVLFFPIFFLKGYYCLVEID